MKKLFFLIIIVSLLGCQNNDIIIDDNNNVNYEIIDTFRISRNGFDYIMGYELIIKIDSSYYSCYYDGERITTIYKKLNIKEL